MSFLTNGAQWLTESWWRLYIVWSDDFNLINWNPWVVSSFLGSINPLSRNHDRNHKLYNIASTEICVNTHRIDVDNLERGSVEHLTDPAIYCCLQGHLWKLGMQKSDGRSSSLYLIANPKEQRNRPMADLDVLFRMCDQGMKSLKIPMRTNNYPQNIYIKLKIEYHEPH